MAVPAQAPEAAGPRRLAGSRPERLGRFVPWLLGSALGLPLLGYASVGAYARYAADDYCTAGILGERGFLAAQAHWYTAFSPRYAFTFLVSLPELAGPAVVPLLPALGLATFLLALTWAASRYTHAPTRGRTLGWCALLAALVAFAVLESTPDRPQSLYWQTGLITYLVPLILLCLYVGALQVALSEPPARGRGRLAWQASLVACTLLPLVAAGMNETFLFAQIAGLGLALAATFAGLGPPASQHRLRRLLVVGLAASLLGLAIILASPAVAARTADSRQPLVPALYGVIEGVYELLQRFRRYFGLVGLLCLALPSLVHVPWRGGGHPGDLPPGAGRPGVVIGLGVAALGVILASYLPASLAQGGPPPARARIVATFVLVAYLVYVGYALRPAVRRLAARVPAAVPGLLVAALLLVPASAALASLPEREAAARYADQWDALDRDIRAARATGNTSLRVPNLPRALGEEFLRPDPTDWFNVCVARFYRLASIAPEGG